MPSKVNELKPVYLIYGEQELLLQRALDRLVKRISDSGGSEFDIDILDGEDASVDTILSSANILPFMAERRLVIVRRADKLSTAELGSLADYAKNPNAMSTLVLVFKKIAKNLRVYKAVDALGGVAEYKPPSKQRFPQFVVEMFAERGKKMGIEAAELFVSAVGYDLRHIDTEIGKVIAYTGDRITLSRKDVEQVVTQTAPPSIFELLEAIGDRNVRGALSLLARLLGSGESIHGVHAMTSRHIRTLISVKAVIDRVDGARGPEGVARAIGGGLQAWQAKRLITQAGKYTSEELVSALRLLASTELEMKTSRDARLAYERWICEVCPQSR
ncbi:MAG: DNA polymerase III subunit delta [Actinobacteria bacterium]|nr:DNA polymerase III subunit delta [Actinomycetota bacterium]MCL5887852.1 DNA polymerase III subunit delta [Actinomycetota bacterium]